MSDEKISQLPFPVTATPTGAELMETAIQNVNNYQIPLNSVRGIGIGKSMSSAYTASIGNPIAGMSFKIQRILRPINPFASLLQTFEDDFTQDCGFYTRTGNIGTTSWVNGSLSVSSTANTFGNGQVFTSFEKFEFPGIAVAMDMIIPTPDAGANLFAIGISKNSNNQLYAYFEIGSGTQNRITIAKVVGGTFSVVTQTPLGSLPAGMTGLCCSYDGNAQTVWIQVKGGSWYPVLNASITDFNLISPAELSLWSPMFQVTGGTTTPWVLGRFRTGYSGSTMFRDYRIVTNKDGTPYVSNGYMYFTATNNYCSVWRLNVKSGRFEKTGGLMFNRGGTLYFDLNAHIVWDQDENKWLVVWATWGNNSFTNVKLFIATYNGDILNGMHTVANGSQLHVSQEAGSNAVYDACLLYDYNLTQWIVAYAFSPGGSFGGNMRIVLDTSPDLVTWTNSWIDAAHLNNEGAWITKIGGNFYVMAGDGAHFNCWNLSGTFEGNIVVDVTPPSAGNPPAHFILFPWFDSDTTQYYSLSWTNVQFNIGGSGVGIFENGSVLLYKASQVETGFEYNASGVI